MSTIWNKDKFTVDITRTLRVRDKPHVVVVEIDGWDYVFVKDDRYKELLNYGDTLAFSHKERTSGT